MYLNIKPHIILKTFACKEFINYMHKVEVSLDIV